jgi:hypothetical protein
MGLEWPDKKPKRDGEYGCFDLAVFVLCWAVGLTSVAIEVLF